MTRVLIIGAGGHAQVVVDILEEMRRAGQAFSPVGYVDDNADLRGREFLGARVLGTLAELDRIPHDVVIVAIGDNPRRRLIVERLISQGCRLGTAVHPTAVIAKSAVIAPGSMICAGVIVNPSTTVGRSAILNTGCSVDHHNQIGDYVHIGPGARLGGTVTIGSQSLIGMGAIVLPNLSIGAQTVVGAGSVVTTTIGDNLTVTGAPARAVERSARS